MKYLLFIVLVLLMPLVLGQGLEAQQASQTIAQDVEQIRSAQQGTVSFLFADFYILNDGSVFVSGRSNIDPQIPGISFNEAEGKFEGNTQRLTSKLGETWIFNLNVEQIYKDINVKIILPRNAKLLTSTLTASTLPFVTSSDSTLTIELIDKDSSLNVKFDYETSAMEESIDLTQIFVLGTVAIVIIVLYIIYIKKFKKKGKEKVITKAKVQKVRERKEGEKHEIKKGPESFRERYESVKVTLNERENKIISALIDLGGKAKQNQLRSYVAIPKASFTRHLFSLERKNLILKKGLGKTNIVELNYEF